MPSSVRAHVHADQMRLAIRRAKGTGGGKLELDGAPLCVASEDDDTQLDDATGRRQPNGAGLHGSR